MYIFCARIFFVKQQQVGLEFEQCNFTYISGIFKCLYGRAKQACSSHYIEKKWPTI